MCCICHTNMVKSTWSWFDDKSHDSRANSFSLFILIIWYPIRASLGWKEKILIWNFFKNLKILISKFVESVQKSKESSAAVKFKIESWDYMHTFIHVLTYSTYNFVTSHKQMRKKITKTKKKTKHALYGKLVCSLILIFQYNGVGFQCQYTQFSFSSVQINFIRMKNI